MNAQSIAPPLASSDVEQRIESERTRLQAEERTEQGLVEQRLGPLESGDDAALDRVEADITACRERQRRISERIQILETRAEEAKDREHGAELDRLTRRAERAREMGERLIRSDYAKQAAALAATLTKLAAVESVIDEANRVLDRNGRTPVPTANSVRYRGGEQWQEAATLKVHLNDARHPLHGRAHVVYPSNSSDNEPFAELPGSNERHPVFAEIEVIEDRHDGGDFPPDLTLTVRLPDVGPSARGNGLVDLWNKGTAQAAKAGAEALAAEIDAELSGGVIGKVGKAASRLFGMEKSK